MLHAKELIEWDDNPTNQTGTNQTFRSKGTLKTSQFPTKPTRLLNVKSSE